MEGRRGGYKRKKNGWMKEIVDRWNKKSGRGGGGLREQGREQRGGKEMKNSGAWRTVILTEIPLSPPITDAKE